MCCHWGYDHWPWSFTCCTESKVLHSEMFKPIWFSTPFPVWWASCLTLPVERLDQNERFLYDLYRLRCAEKKVKVVYSSFWVTHHRTMDRHLPYGITRHYLPPDTGEHALPESQVGTQLIYPGGIEGCSNHFIATWPTVELTIVQRFNCYDLNDVGLIAV